MPRRASYSPNIESNLAKLYGLSFRLGMERARGTEKAVERIEEKRADLVRRLRRQGVSPVELLALAHEADEIAMQAYTAFAVK